MDFTIRLERDADGDVAVFLTHTNGTSEEQAAYFASALSDALDWQELHDELEAIAGDAARDERLHGGD